MRHYSSIAATALITLTACGAPSASVTPFIASVGINGDLAVGDGAGTSVASTFDDLGLDDNEAVVGGLVRLNFAGAELSIAGYGVDFAGTGTATGDFEFQGSVISAGTNVASDVRLNTARALFTWDIIPLDGLDLGIGFGATLLDLDLSLRELGGAGTSIQSEELIPVPLLAARAAWTWGRVDLRADAGGLVIEYDESEASIFDIGVSAQVDLFGVGDLVVGYKTMKIDAEYSDDDARIDTDLDLDGYYMGVQFSF
ncbi:MAG: hypothetical protein P8M11_01385 [Planctomycetota bacterium]|nr:hypothetical protein [Planctomycetota bacterium]